VGKRRSYRLGNGAPSVRPVSCADVTVLKLNPKGTKVRRATELPLPRAFYARDAVTVARDLLGKVLVRRDADSRRVGRIVEVEAYLEEQDLAAHSAAGPTSRNNVLFGPPGHAYVYFIYGNHYCLNISCEPKGKAGSVLIRALEPLTGIAEMAKERGVKMRDPDDVRDWKKLTSGPGRLAEALGITRARHNGADLTDKKSGLWVASGNRKVGRIAVTARIGITKAADLPLRFVIAGNPFVSGKRMPEIDLSGAIFRAQRYR
jgi:DNA-3-methyladenine glycosylase